MPAIVMRDGKILMRDGLIVVANVDPGDPAPSGCCCDETCPCKILTMTWAWGTVTLHPVPNGWSDCPDFEYVDAEAGIFAWAMPISSTGDGYNIGAQWNKSNGDQIWCAGHLCTDANGGRYVCEGCEGIIQGEYQVLDCADYPLTVTTSGCANWGTEPC